MGPRAQRTMTAPRFAFPEKLSFDCTRCGDCCRGWHVMLGPGEADRLRALDWAGRADDLEGASIAVERGNKVVLARRDDGACVFLGDDNECRIHEHHGGDAKPLMCRMFPFGFLPIGDRVAVDVSFACRAVSEGSGRPLAVREPEWSKIVGDVGDERKHRFSKKYDVDGALLWELEHHLLDILGDDSLSLLQRIVAVSEFMRLATTSDPRTDAARELRRVMASGVRNLARERRLTATMDKTQRAIFFHLVFLHLNPTPSELETASGKTRQKEVKRRVQAADGYKFSNARPWIDNREIAVTHRDVGATDSEFFLNAPGARLVERYLEAKILGQRFMREGESELPLVEAVPRLLLVFPMLVWTSKALAADEGRHTVSDGDARRALRLIDRSYGEVRLFELPAKQRKAWDFILRETDLATCASVDVLARGASE